MKLIKLLALLPMLLMVSCSNEEETALNETMEVQFTAKLPLQSAGTRAASDDVTADEVVCAVFENGKELTNLREYVTITPGEDIIFSPRLIKDRTYKVVFWADKEGCYSVTDLTSITRAENANANETDFDAFTNSVEVHVTSQITETIVLHRPFAQLNIGVTQEDWDAVANENTFNMEPSTMKISLKGKSAFDALNGVATGNDVNMTYSLPVSGESLVCDGVSYKSIALCYVLPEAGKENFNLTYSLYDKKENAIRENVEITNVPVQANYRTNIVGNLLTGTVTYKITITKEFATGDKNHELEIKE